MGRAVSPLGPRVGHWVALVGIRDWEGGEVLTVGLVGLVGMGGVLPPGDVVVCGWPPGSLWPSRGSWGWWGGVVWYPRGVSGCRWVEVPLGGRSCFSGPSFPPPGRCGSLVRRSGLFGCRWVPLGAVGPSWGRRGVVVGGWLVVGGWAVGVVWAAGFVSVSCLIWVFGWCFGGVSVSFQCRTAVVGRSLVGRWGVVGGWWLWSGVLAW